MPPSTLTVSLLGTPLVESSGPAWALAGLKAQALLYYLAASGQPYTRDHLSALLWGDAPVENARHSLRSALHKLRQALRACGAEACLLADGERIALDMRAVACDLRDFQGQIADGGEPALRAAVGLVRGPFLQGFGLPDAALFDEFVQQQEARVAHSYLAALDRLAALAEQREDWERAIAYARLIAQADPLAEPAQQRLIALYVRSGAPGLARQHYVAFERVLRQELGIAPAPQTADALRAAAAREQAARAVPAAAPFVAGGPQRLGFCGRDSELAQLLARARRAAGGRGAALLIEGEAGIGKSRLADELLAALPAGRPWTLLRGRCSPYDSILAYGPFREALGPLLPERAAAEQGLVAQGVTGADHFAGDVLRALDRLGQGGPVALALDDLHSADRQTLELFGYLALHLQRLPLLLIGTVQRSAEVGPLQELIALGRRHGDLELLALAPLAPAAVDALLAGQSVVATARESLGPWLHARSAGNPFVIEALLGQLRAEGVLQPAAAGWQLDGGRWLVWRATAPLPTSTHDLVALRLRALDPAARQIVDLLAVAGGQLSPALIAAALGPGGPALGPALDELLARGLADEADDALALPHPLLRETALHQLGGLARRDLHRRLAAACEQHEPAAAEPIARHAVAGGDVARARRYGLALLGELPYSYAGAETVAFLQRLHDLVAPTASDDERRRLAHALGQAYRSLGQLAPAGDWHRRQLALAQAAQAPAQEALAHFELAELAFLRADYSAAAAGARAGIERSAAVPAPARPALTARGHRLLGGALAIEGGDLPAAERHLRLAVAGHRQTGDMVNLSAALFELGNAMAQQGAIGQAVGMYREAAAAIAPDQAPFLHALAQNNLAYHSLLLGLPGDARAALARGRAAAERHALSGALLHLLSTEGELALYVGDWDAAQALARHGLELAEALGNQERQAGYQATLALAAAGAGRHHEAAAGLEGALALIAGRAFWHTRTRILLALADLWLDRDPAAAGGYLDAALGLGRAHGRLLLLLQGERLQALRLAGAGRAAEAQAQLVALLDRAAALGLGLEVARSRAALARVTLAQAPRSSAGRAQLTQALRELEAYGAAAEVAALAALAPAALLAR